MSQNLEFRITAQNQASAVIASVQKKVGEFGKDIGRSIAAVAGPMAIATMAFSKISARMEEMRQKSKDAFNWGAGLERSAQDLGVTVRDMQRIESVAAETGQSVGTVGEAFKAASNLIQQAKQGNLDAAASLSAMGFNLEELEKIKPEDVIKRIGEAMATAVDPADKLKIAIGALGKEGEKLQGILAKGFDVAKAFQNAEGLTDEEAAFLAQQEKDARARANRERLETARREASRRFLEDDPQGRAIVAAEQERMRRLAGPAGGPASMGGFGIGAQTLATDPRIQAEVQRILAERARAAAAANPPTPAAVSAGEALRERGERAGDAPDIKPPRVKPAPSIAGMEASSLRAIGGALAGDSSIRNTEEERTEIQRQIRDRLDRIIEMYRPGVDFTKGLGEKLGPIFRILTK
jgi:hypothetical protein